MPNKKLNISQKKLFFILLLPILTQVLTLKSNDNVKRGQKWELEQAIKKQEALKKRKTELKEQYSTELESAKIGAGSKVKGRTKKFEAGRIVKFDDKEYNLASEKDWEELLSKLPEDDFELFKKYSPDKIKKRAQLIREKGLILPKLTEIQKNDLELETNKLRIMFVIDKLLNREPISKKHWEEARKACKEFSFDPNDIELELEIYIANHIILPNEYNKAKIEEFAQKAHAREGQIKERELRKLLNAVPTAEMTRNEKREWLDWWKSEREKKWQALGEK